ncbi:MAG: hypothetical protein ACPGVG_00375 [Mycobacterium sp.]
MPVEALAQRTALESRRQRQYVFHGLMPPVETIVPSGTAWSQLAIAPGVIQPAMQASLQGAFSVAPGGLSVPLLARWSVAVAVGITDADGGSARVEVELRAGGQQLTAPACRLFLVNNAADPNNGSIPAIVQTSGELQLWCRHDRGGARTIVVQNQQWHVTFLDNAK